MKTRNLLAAVVAALLFFSVAHAQQKQQAPPPAQSSKKSPEKPKRQRVVTDLSGFDLLEPKKLKRQTMVVGATRGLPRPVALAPRLGKVYAADPVFAWSYEGKAQEFLFVLWNDAKEEVFRAQVTGSSYRYPSEAPRLQAGKTYFWTVEAVSALLGASPSAPVGFLVVSPEQHKEIEQALTRAGGGNSYEAGLARARVFTDHRLWYDALAAYADLIAHHPGRAELYEKRGTIYAQLEATQGLADADFTRAEELLPGGKTP